MTITLQGKSIVEVSSLISHRSILKNSTVNYISFSEYGPISEEEAGALAKTKLCSNHVLWTP